MDALLQPLALHCQRLISQDSGLYASLLVTGAVGGVTHCAGMCGPLVAAQVASRLESVPAADMREWRRLTGAALAPYHLGRLTTYALLGALAGGFSSLLFTGVWLERLSSLMLAAAGILFLMNGLGKGILSLPSLPSRVSRIASPLWRNPMGWRGYALGVTLGFLPCGLVLAALMAVATTGSAAGGALGMAIFGLGTVPALFGVGLGSHLLARRWRRESALAARGAMMVSGLMLCVMAARTLV